MDTGKWISELDEMTAAVKAEFGGLTAIEMMRKPTANAWSIAENLDHLIKVNNTYPPVLEQMRSGSYSLPFIAKIGFLVKATGNMILDSVQPNRKRKMKTFPIWEPAVGASVTIADFEKHQEEIKQMIRASQDLLGRNAKLSSPANRNLVYTLDKAFDIICSHERRHLEQMREVKKLISN